MNIDHKWVGEVAGWKALKAGRALWKAGRVAKSSREGDLFYGEIPGAGAPKRVRVQVNGRFDVDCHCQCLESKRTGAMCPHAVAVILEVLEPRRNEKKEVKSPEDEVEARMLALEFPPHFPEKIEKGLAVKLSEYETEQTTVADITLWKWVLANLGGEVSPVLGLSPKQTLEFLQAVDGHVRIKAGEEPLRVVLAGNRIPFEAELDEDRICLSIDSDYLKSGKAWYSDGYVWLWSSTTRILGGVVDKSGLLKAEQWGRLCSGLPLYVSVQSVISRSEQWADSVQWKDELFFKELRILPGSPEFILNLDGSTERLSAHLVACYSSEVEVDPSNEHDMSEKFPIEQADGSWHVRNREEEDAAVGMLMRAGFIIDGGKKWSLSGDDAVLEFLSGALVRMEEHWTVVSGQRLRSARSNMVRLVPDIDIQGSGEDWLAFDYGFKTEDGKKVTREQIKRMLDAGRTSAALKNGKRIVMSSFDATVMSAALQDCDPRQEGGKYYVSKHQGAYIKRLKSFYSSKEGQPTLDLTVLSDLPNELSGLLRPYQQEGVSWLYRRMKEDGAALLADDMGLGKTLQSLCLLQLWKQRSKATSVVVCPTSLLGNWESEAKLFTPELKVMILHGASRKELFSKFDSVDLVITSYALIARDLEFYREQSLGCLIIDEASLIRNPDTQAAKALRLLDAEAKIALTGTPVENAVRDLWSIYAFLLPGYLGSREDFKDRYESGTAGSSPDLSVLRRLRMRTEPFMLRRTKAKVASDLPPKLEQIVLCELSARQKEVYQQVHRAGVEQVDELREQGQQGHMQMLTVLLRLRQTCCHLGLLGDGISEEELEQASVKLVRLLEIVQEAIRGGHRVLVFSQFTKMLGLIKTQFAKHEIDYCYLDGSTRDRAAEVKKFQEPTGPPVFLISLKAGGYGLNLTAADTVVHFDPWWNPAVEAQATDRAHRIGQTRATTVYKLITTGTVEEKILRLQDKKRTLIGGAISDDAQPLMKGLDSQEIANLLR